VGDRVLLEKKNYGYLTTDRFECGKDLWLLAVHGHRAGAVPVHPAGVRHLGAV
jgi:hypothetical protein